MNKVTQNAINMACGYLKIFEGLKLTPYLDSKGIPTIGIGSTFYQDNTKVTMVDKAITEEQAYALLIWHITTQVIPAIEMVLTPLSDIQNAALICLVYNIGSNGFKTSTLFKLLNTCVIKTPLTQEMWLCWNKIRINGELIPSAGLTARRKTEWAIFNTDIGTDVELVDNYYKKLEGA